MAVERLSDAELAAHGPLHVSLAKLGYTQVGIARVRPTSVVYGATKHDQHVLFKLGRPRAWIGQSRDARELAEQQLLIEGFVRRSLGPRPWLLGLQDTIVIAGHQTLRLTAATSIDVSDIGGRAGEMTGPLICAVAQELSAAVAQLHEHHFTHGRLDEEDVALGLDGRVRITDLATAGPFDVRSVYGHPRFGESVGDWVTARLAADKTRQLPLPLRDVRGVARVVLQMLATDEDRNISGDQCPVHLARQLKATLGADAPGDPDEIVRLETMRIPITRRMAVTLATAYLSPDRIAGGAEELASQLTAPPSDHVAIGRTVHGLVA